ncbi:MAG TPA: anti-sigma factor [Usitatibacter sp.]|jgi:anti-sigma factor RsiW|nr:anti-sigma factor [Usitatibacter sp.]
MTEEEDRVEYAEQNAMLHRLFDQVLTEPIPARMYMKRQVWLEYARAAVLIGAGVAIGLAMPWLRPEPTVISVTTPSLPVRAARAHLVYSPEVRHPVEVEAKDKDHLVKWLSKRLGMPLKVPALSNEGFELLGGRLLPGPEGAVAQFMYQDATGKRLTLYVSPPHAGERVTAFRFAQDNGVSVFYWIDKDLDYALSGEVDKPTLARVASSVYRQIEP